MMDSMTSAAPQPPVVRLPLQERSRLAWQRILDAAVDVLCDVGVARFNISAVCNRAGVAMTAVYSRVDSRDDLLHAAYDQGVADLQATELQLAAAYPRPSPRAAVDVLAGVFARHARFLRPSILGANDDAYLLARGTENIARARQAFIHTAVGDDASAEQQNKAATLFTATFSTLAFELAFGQQLIRTSARDNSVAELHAIADSFLPTQTGNDTHP